MTQNELVRLVSMRERKIGAWVFVVIGVGLILINTDADEAGYWLLGAALALLGMLVQLNRAYKEHLVLAELVEVDSSGTRIIKAEGLTIKAKPESIEKSKALPSYSRIKGTAVLFRNDDEAQQVGMRRHPPE